MEISIAVIVSVIGLCLTIVQFIKDFILLRRTTLKEYFEKGNSKEFQKDRYRIYANKKKYIEYKSDEELVTAISSTVEFFEYWARLQHMHYLPMSVFKDSSGIGVCNLYKALEGYITERRKDNKYYACNFEWLCKKIRKKNKKLFEN